jgi:hypothetical protein
MEMKVSIEGIVPLLMNNPASMSLQKSGKSAVYDPQVEAEARLYKNSAGVIYVPSTHILAAIREAGSDFKIPGKGKKTFKKVLYGLIRITPEQIPVISDGEWEIDARHAVINRARVMKWRPKFNTWKLDFNISTVTNDSIYPGTLREILESAGIFNGVGDFRPLFGLFNVTSFTDVDGKEIAGGVKKK